MNLSSRHLKGFSLLEVLVSMFIFSLVMVGVTTYFASIAKANQNSKRLQQNLEDVRFSMNRIAKVLRTSVAITTMTGSASTLRVYDYSQGKCIEYKFTGGTMQESVSSGSASSGTDEKLWCAGLSSSGFSSPSALVDTSGGTTLAGNFFVVPSDDGASGGQKRAGQVTMSATVTRQATSSTIQTTVSLRNYQESYH